MKSHPVDLLINHHHYYYYFVENVISNEWDFPMPSIKMASKKIINNEWGWDNSSDNMKAEFNNCFIVHSH